MTKIITWNGIPSTVIDGLIIGQVWRDLLGEQRDSEIFVPGKTGSWWLPQERGRREIRAQMSLLATSIAGRRPGMNEIADWLDVSGDSNLKVSDEAGVFYVAALAGVSQPDEWRHLGKFEVTWRAMPLAYDDAVSVESWTAGVSTSHVFNPALNAETYPVITVTPTNGTLTDFEIEANGNVLRYVGLINDDATITINSLVPVVNTGTNEDTELTGVWNPLTRDMSGVSGEFPTLLPGSNDVQFTKNAGTATTINLVVSYRKNYRK